MRYCLQRRLAGPTHAPQPSVIATIRALPFRRGWPVRLCGSSGCNRRLAAPIETSNSGKTVYLWHASWQRTDQPIDRLLEEREAIRKAEEEALRAKDLANAAHVGSIGERIDFGWFDRC